MTTILGNEVDWTELLGEWVGYYPGHHDEIIEVGVSGEWLVATKVTGDPYIPADEITWRLHLPTNRAEGQVAEYEFHNPRFIPGRLEVLADDRIRFHWIGLSHIDFHRDE